MPFLHVITTDEIVARSHFVQTAELIIATMGEQGAFHLRTRCLSGRDYFKLATHLTTKASESSGMLVVNDRVDIALTSHAHGVQLGRTSLSVGEVRHIAQHTQCDFLHDPQHGPLFGTQRISESSTQPNIQVGASIHSISDLYPSADTQNPDAQNLDADWYIFGHMFETTSHRGAPPQSLDRLEDVCNATDRPIIAIGGITPQNGESAIKAGARGLAVISGIWGAREPKEAVINYLSLHGNRS